MQSRRKIPHYNAKVIPCYNAKVNTKLMPNLACVGSCQYGWQIHGENVTQGSIPPIMSEILP